MRKGRARAALGLGILLLSACSRGEPTGRLGETGPKLRLVNRLATKTEDRDGVRLSSASGNGIAWVEGIRFRTGTIELDVRGRESMSQSFVGVAFHGTNDTTYEGVYLRPFNFRAADPARRQHAVQYIAMPSFDFDRLRADFPEEFENPVAAALEPTDWVRLRVVVDAGSVRIYVGTGGEITLRVRKLGQLEDGTVGLWVGNRSGGDFANLVVTPTAAVPSPQ
jgi:hypothetical protein